MERGGIMNLFTLTEKDTAIHTYTSESELVLPKITLEDIAKEHAEKATNDLNTITELIQKLVKKTKERYDIDYELNKSKEPIAIRAKKREIKVIPFTDYDKPTIKEIIYTRYAGNFNNRFCNKVYIVYGPEGNLTEIKFIRVINDKEVFDNIKGLPSHISFLKYFTSLDYYDQGIVKTGIPSVTFGDDYIRLHYNKPLELSKRESKGISTKVYREIYGTITIKNDGTITPNFRNSKMEELFNYKYLVSSNDNINRLLDTKSLEERCLLYYLGTKEGHISVLQ